MAVPDRPGVQKLVNREELVYGYWISDAIAMDVFFFKGDLKSLNRFLEELSEIKGTPSRLIIHPGRAPAQVRFSGKPVQYDWKLESYYRWTPGDPPRTPKNRQSDYLTTVEVWLGGNIAMELIKGED